MDYLRKFVTKLLYNTNIYYQQNMVITYSEMAHTILGAMIFGILGAYESHYPLLDVSWYCVYIWVGYLVYTAIKIVLRSNVIKQDKGLYNADNVNNIHSNMSLFIQWFSTYKLVIITVCTSILLGIMSNYHVHKQINDYVGNAPFYSHQEGEYVVLVDSPVEITNIDGVAYKKLTAQLFGVIPYKDTAKNTYIQAHGNLKITIEERGPSIQMGQFLIIKSTPKSMYLTEEKGAIDSRSRAIRNNIKGNIFGGTYKLVLANELQQYSISPVTVYYARLLSFVGYMRQWIEQTMIQHLSDPTKWLGASLILGGHYGELGDDILRQFGYTGIIHILSISGSHIALLFSMIYGLCRLSHIKKRYAMIGSIVISIMYCCLVGFSAPVVRSTVMGMCMAMAYLLGRLYAAKQGLAMTAILFLLYDPLLILDISFQLSFGATYGLLIFGMPLYRWFTILPPILKAPLVISVSAQLIMIPFQLYYFHYLSIASLISALVVTPLLDICIVLLFIASIINSILPISLLWLCIDMLLKLALTINSYIANNSMLIIWIGIMPLSFVGAYMIGLNALYIMLISLKQRFSVGILITLLYLVSILGISYSGIYFKNKTIVHIVPLKQAHIMILAEPYYKRAIVYIDAPDGIPMKASEYRIINALHSVGIIPSQAKVERFEITGHNRILYENNMGTVMVYNRQREEKKLQLKDTKQTILVTAQSHIAHQLAESKILLYNVYPTIQSRFFEHFNFGTKHNRAENQHILLTMPRSVMRDIDPDSELLELWGYHYIPDKII